MSLWAIIPVKPLRQAKSRLARVLSPRQRYQLAQATFRHVLGVTASVERISGTLVISRDTEVLALARELGARTLQEGALSDLNPALLRATLLASSWRADAVLILPADLPFLKAEDIQAIIQLGGERSVVIAPDQRGDGTNALLTRPPGLISYDYGPGSYQRHIDQARAAGAALRTYQSESIALDIDLPRDLEAYQRRLARGAFANLPSFPDALGQRLQAPD